MSLVLALVMCMGLAVPAFASEEADSTPTAGFVDMYAQGATDEAVIEGVVYTFHYFYEDGKRVITITNDADSKIEKVEFDPRTATTSFYESSKDVSQPLSDEPTGVWIYMGSGSQYVSWGLGKSVSFIAGEIAARLGDVGGPYVIVQIGLNRLAEWADSAIGGTIYVDNYYMNVPTSLPPISYLHVWSFTASNGDSVGPFALEEAPLT